MRRESALDLLAHQRRLGVDVEAAEHEGDLVAVAAERVEPDLERVGRRLPAHVADAHPVLRRLLELDGVEAGGHVGAEIARALDLVEQLRRDRLDGHRTAGARMLGDDA